MVKIRLMRVGSKNNPHYRLIAVPARTKRDTKALEILGHYNPKTKEVVFKKDRIAYWRDKGAQLTDTVERLMGEKPKRDYSKNKRVLLKQQADQKSKEAKKQETKKEKPPVEEKKEEKKPEPKQDKKEPKKKEGKEEKRKES